MYVTFDNFYGVGHPLTMYDVQAESVLQLIIQIKDYLNKNPIVSGETVEEIINSYLEEHPITGAVTSVNGQTGAVTISIPITSVNGKTGAVVIEQSDIDGLAAALAEKYSAGNPPPYPVTSVNGQTGAVTISAPDAPVTSVNNKTGAVVIAQSDIAGLVADLAAKYSAGNPPPYPVTSVNGQTGAVTVGGDQWGSASVAFTFDGGEENHSFTPPADMNTETPAAFVINDIYSTVMGALYYNSATQKMQCNLYRGGSSFAMVDSNITLSILYFKG